MSPTDTPLTQERIVTAAEDVIRRFGPAKATLIDVARALGVSHAAVYRHVASKAELRDLVVERWIEQAMVPVRASIATRHRAPLRLRHFYDALLAVKRRRASEDPELFLAYRTLAADSTSIVAAHIDELIELSANIIEVGINEGTFHPGNARAISRALLFATFRFHHPAHAAEWSDPNIDEAYDDVWKLLMNGLCIPRMSAPKPRRQRD